MDMFYVYSVILFCRGIIIITFGNLPKENGWMDKWMNLNSCCSKIKISSDE